MGYAVTLTKAHHFTIDPANEPAVFLRARDAAQRIQGLTAHSLDEAFEICRMDLVRTDNVITSVDFIGENEGDDTPAILDAAAPFLPDDAYVEFAGEDGAKWRFVIENGAIARKEATVTW